MPVKAFPVLLGGNELNLGIAEVLADKFGGVVVIDRNESLPDGYQGVPSLEHLAVDYRDAALCIGSIRKVMGRSIGAITSADEAVPTAARLNQALGRHFSDVSASGQVLSKTFLQQSWAQSGIHVPDGQALSPHDRIPSRFFDGGMVIKPDRASGSRGVRVFPEIPSADEAHSALQESAEMSFNKMARVETFISGDEFTVELIADSKGRVHARAVSAKTHSPHVFGTRVATVLHYNSPDVSQRLTQALGELGVACMKSLKLAATFGHLEAIVRPDGSIVPIEMGARSSGFVASHLVTAASGRDYLSDYFAVLGGADLSEKTTNEEKTSSAYVFVDLPFGALIRKPVQLDRVIPEGVTVLHESVSRIVPRLAPKVTEDSGRLGYLVISAPKQTLTRDVVAKIQAQLGSSLTGDGG